MQDERVDLNKQDNNNRTPIWVASASNCTQVVQAILQSGRHINLDAKYNNKTAIQQARKNGYYEIVNLIENYMKNPVTIKLEPVSQSKNKKKQGKTKNKTKQTKTKQKKKQTNYN